MSLLAPLGLLGLLGVVALIIIYIIKPNYQSKFISSTFIWKLSLKYKKKRIPLSKLRNILIFICQVLILTASAFILAQPFIDNSTKVENGDTVMIIDSSASMHAQAGGTTRFERAVSQVLTDAKDAIDNGNKVSVILAGKEAEFIIQQAGADRASELYGALEALVSNPTDAYTYSAPDIEGAMQKAEQITGTTKDVVVTLYTDTTYLDTDQVQIYPIKDISEWNAAILDVRTILVENYYRIEIDIASYGKDENVAVECSILNANQLGTTMKIESVAYCVNDEITTLVFARVPAEGEGNMSEAEKNLITEDVSLFSFEQIFVKISENDSLSYDNTYYVYGGEKPTLKVLYQSALPNNYFTAALLVVQNALSDSWNIEITEVSDGEPIIKGYDLYIYEHATPKTLPDDGVVFCVNPSGLASSTGVRLGATASSNTGKEIFFDETEESHPLLNNIISTDISVTMFREILSADGFSTLLSVKGYPMLLAKNEADSKMVILPFSLHYSNLAILPEFPILMMNIMNYYFPATVDEYVFETESTIQLNGRADFLEVSDPTGLKQTITPIPADYNLTAPGTYTITQYPISGTPSIDSIFVKIPAEESNINLVESKLVNPYFYSDADDLNIDLLFYFALAMVALLFIEWWLKSREQI